MQFVKRTKKLTAQSIRYCFFFFLFCCFGCCCCCCFSYLAPLHLMLLHGIGYCIVCILFGWFIFSQTSVVSFSTLVKASSTVTSQSFTFSSFHRQCHNTHGIISHIFGCSSFFSPRSFHSSASSLFSVLLHTLAVVLVLLLCVG